MKFKLLIIFTVLILASVSILIINSRQNQEKIRTPLPTKLDLSPTKFIKIGNKEYQDPSGFKFKYPENLQVKSLTELDVSYYSSLVISSSNKKGKISIEVSETKYQSLTDWQKNNSNLVKQIKNSKLADLDAFLIEKSDQLMLLAIDTGALFSFNAQFPSAEAEFWKNSFNSIISSFAFFEAKNSSSQTETDSGLEEDIIFEGEETVE